MRVGFLNNQIDNRGTGNALYDYAHYNETILGNESVIFTLSHRNADQGMQDRLVDRFGDIWSIWALIDGRKDLQVDFLYHIKYGNNDGTLVSPYGVHAVFDGSDKHGDRYATISAWMGSKYEIPYVPHIIKLVQPDRDLRKELDIPDGARVFGRHGGEDTFDISWAWEAINDAMEADESIYCVFLNTTKPEIPLSYPKRFRFLPSTSDEGYKSAFIYACDAMVHARARGETFGIAVGEFAYANKPVLTYGYSGERAHIDQLGSLGYLYHEKQELTNLLLTVNSRYWYSNSQYKLYTPENVMKKFQAVFLS